MESEFMEEDKHTIELPKLNEEELFKTRDLGLGTVVNNSSEVYVIKSKKNYLWIFALINFIVITICFVLFNKEAVILSNNVSILKVEIVNYIPGKDTVDIAVVPSTNQAYCGLLNSITGEEITFQKLSNEKCYLTVPLEEQVIFFKNDKSVSSKKLSVNNYVVYINLVDKYYMPVNSVENLYNDLVVVGNPDIKWVSSLENIITIENDLIKSNNVVGNVSVKAMVDNTILDETNIVVTDTIVNIPKKFNENKSFLSCEQFTSDEAKLLDEILAYRIEEAGYGTRAGAVAAARFLTLEFPYRISYRWESGRLNNTGRHYVDGEGRWYHKGMYLDKSKYENLEASLFGPAMWGCKMISYEDDPPYFKPGVKYPNGLDCSGFVSWSLLNGGFDVGDRGAGELASDGQLTDLGEFTRVTSSLIKSGKIKVGDLFNFSGHISILVGQDENNYYIAESLNNFGGVVIKTYSKKNVANTFKYVVLMDEVYQGDGNLTDMWY
jgi:hypothetical protein